MATGDRTRGGQPSDDGWELVLCGRDRRVFRLPSIGVVTIGRGPHCDVRLEHESVSRKHARLFLPSLEVEDLDSRNGSFVLEQMQSATVSAVLPKDAAPPRRLRPGERARLLHDGGLRLGEVRLQLQRGAPDHHTLPVMGSPEEAHGEPVLSDPAMIQLYQLAERTANTGLPLLILGETGVGKDVLAARVHQASARSKAPFVRINCGALSESLLESELFGHQRGAFTGASDAKPGLFELGHTGSVFLDEIGELPLRTQVKLLHVLETNQVTRVGATKSRHIDVRFIAATNRELARDVQAGTFRKDLYFRINTLCLKINPLRERKADIVPLVRYFLRQTCTAAGVTEPELAEETLQHLESYGWPGNVRELKNAVARARLLCERGPLRPEHFPTEEVLLNRAPVLGDLWVDAEEPTRIQQRSGLDSSSGVSPEKAALIEALNACGGNQTRAAEMLGISRRTMVNRLNEIDLPRPRKGKGR